MGVCFCLGPGRGSAQPTSATERRDSALSGLCRSEGRRDWEVRPLQKPSQGRVRVNLTLGVPKSRNLYIIPELSNSKSRTHGS